MSPLARTFQSIRYADQASLRQAARFRGPALDLLMRGFTRAGDWQTWTVLALAALAAGQPFREIALLVLPRLGLTLAICYAIKTLSRRPRPARSMDGFAALLRDPDPYSFPSSHSACAWVVCVSLALILGGGAPVWLAYAALISYSRIHVGAHYPLDVLIGTAIGVSVALL